MSDQKYSGMKYDTGQYGKPYLAVQKFGGGADNGVALANLACHQMPMTRIHCPQPTVICRSAEDAPPHVCTRQGHG